MRVWFKRKAGAVPAGDVEGLRGPRHTEVFSKCREWGVAKPWTGLGHPMGSHGCRLLRGARCCARHCPILRAAPGTVYRKRIG
jgi:hypothetical protein